VHRGWAVGGRLVWVIYVPPYSNECYRSISGGNEMK
jgi:hypothetical protein